MELKTRFGRCAAGEHLLPDPPTAVCEGDGAVSFPTSRWTPHPVRSAGSSGLRRKAVLMRRIVRDFVHTAVTRARPALEKYIGQHLRYPEPFPFTLTGTTAALHELRSVQVTPRFLADYPLVDVTVTARVLLTAETRRRDVDLGLRTFSADVEVRALGTVQAAGYAITPQEAHLTAWWGHSPATSLPAL